MRRMGTIDAQRTAYLDISARITALLSRLGSLSSATSFQATTAASSLPDVLSASSTYGAPAGSYSFVVRALATRHQFVTRGFHDRTAPLPIGTLTIESARARVDRHTGLDELNGHTGVRRGSFKISNDGQEATINLTDALTVGDVLEKINSAGINVHASITGDGLILRDAAGGGGELRVVELDGGRAAEDLGFGPGSHVGYGELQGEQVLYLADTTPISALNDGLGIRHSVAGGDFTISLDGTQIDVDLSDLVQADTRLQRLNHGQGVRLGTIRITSRDGTMRDLDLSAAENINDVISALESAWDDERISVVMTGSRLLIQDNTDVEDLDDEQVSDFTIADVSGFAARDLGIEGSVNGKKVSGGDILHMNTLADVLTAISYATGNEDADGSPLVVAAIGADGRGLTLSSEGSGGGAMTLELPEGSSSQALADLGFVAGIYADATIAGGRILGGIDTVLLKTLNGGAGLVGGLIQIDANGSSAVVDLSGAETLSEIVNLINQAAEDFGLGVDAGYDSTGTRLIIANVDGDGPVAISDVEGDFAASAGLTEVGTVVRGVNLQRQYVSETTLLGDLNAGGGVSHGRFTIQNSDGLAATVNLSSSSYGTLQDVITAINELNIDVEARINDTGDGLLIVDNAGGGGELKIEEDGGTLARDLNILGESQDGLIDGSFEFSLDIGGGETLESLADRIGSETSLADAAVLNDGSGVAPYRLSITAAVSGAAGELIIDDSENDLGISTLSRAQDAQVFFGSGAGGGVLLTSSDNTFEDVIEGVSITVNAVDDNPVTVTVARDFENLVETVSGLVNDYNTAMERISEVGAYDQETEVAGVLLGESTLRAIENRLYDTFTQVFRVGGAFSRLRDLGIKVESGSRLTFDRDKFQEAYETDPEALQQFFTDEDNGMATLMKERIEAITDSEGMIESRTDTLQDQKDLLQNRVDMMNERLDRKRARLLREFQVMEASLATLQMQQSVLANLAALAQQFTLAGYGGR